jgi:hypothetical protein
VASQQRNGGSGWRRGSWRQLAAAAAAAWQRNNSQ